MGQDRSSWHRRCSAEVPNEAGSTGFIHKEANGKLRAAGIRFLSDPAEHGDQLGRKAVVILPAFGVTVAELEQYVRLGCTVIDTTCGHCQLNGDSVFFLLEVERLPSFSSLLERCRDGRISRTMEDLHGAVTG